MSDEKNLPEAPYPEKDGMTTGGWSGSDTSHERARHERATGALRRRQTAALAMLADEKEHGATWREVAAAIGAHHGSASGVLSNLHKAGRIARLSEKRKRCKVYVLPDYVAGRAHEAYGRKKGGDYEDGFTDGYAAGYAQGIADALGGEPAAETLF